MGLAFALAFLEEYCRYLLLFAANAKRGYDDNGRWSKKEYKFFPNIKRYLNAWLLSMEKKWIQGKERQEERRKSESTYKIIFHPKVCCAEKFFVVNRRQVIVFSVCED